MKRIAVIISIAMLLVAGASFVAYRFYIDIEVEMKGRFIRGELTLVKHIAREVEIFVDILKRKLIIASLMPSIKKGDERCLTDMKEIYEQARDINLLFRLNEKGIAIHCLPEERLKGMLGKDFSFRTYFKEIKRTGKSFISGMVLAGGEKYEDVEGRFKAILIVTPVYDNNSFTGVLGISIDFPSLLKKIIEPVRVQTGSTKYCWIIDDRGVFIFHPNKEFIGKDAFTARKKRFPDLSFEKINIIMLEKMMNGESGTDTYISGWHREQRGRIEKLFAYAPIQIDSRQYSLARVTTKEEVTLLVRKYFQNTLIIIGGISVIGLFGLLFILRIDRERIRHLEMEKELAKEVKESRDYLENLLESANDLIYTVDISGNFTYLNSRIEDYGYTADELLGEHFLTILTEKHRGRRFEKSIQEEVRQIYEVELKTKDGALRICRISTSPVMDSNGNVNGLFAIGRDITEREKLTEELRKKNEELENFVYFVSHDLKSPIVSLQGFASILLKDYKDKLGKEGKKYLERVLANARHMENLVSDLLTLSRISRPARPFKEFSCNKLIKDVCLDLQPLLEKKGIEILIGNNIPTIYADRERIYQVFLNLLTNAIKFMGDTENPRIEVGYEENEQFHQCYVRDNGIGINSRYQRRIFEIFQRLKEVEDKEGTGAGLTIVERIVANHGGRVWVESEKGKGATFYFTIPKG